MLRAVSLAFSLGLVVGCRTAPAVEDPPPSSSEPTTLEPAPLPTCDGQPCAAPRECISYFGIAGPSGPTFYACEIRCWRDGETDACPDGTRCVTIADGPGDVCR